MQIAHVTRLQFGQCGDTPAAVSPGSSASQAIQLDESGRQLDESGRQLDGSAGQLDESLREDGRLDGHREQPACSKWLSGLCLNGQHSEAASDPARLGI